MEDMVRHNAVITHGTVMGFAFAFLFPLGAILIRVASFRGSIWVHAAIQSLAYALALAGLGLGIYIAVYPSPQVSQPLSAIRRPTKSLMTYCRSPEKATDIPSSASSSSAAYTSNPSSQSSTTKSAARPPSAQSGPSPTSGGVASSCRSVSSTGAWVSSSAGTLSKGE